MDCSLEGIPVWLVEHTESLPLYSDVHHYAQAGQNQCFLCLYVLSHTYHALFHLVSQYEDASTHIFSFSCCYKKDQESKFCRWQIFSKIYRNQSLKNVYINVKTHDIPSIRSHYFFKKKYMSYCWSGPWGHQWVLLATKQPYLRPPQPLPMDSGSPFQLSPGVLLFLPKEPGWTHWDGDVTYNSSARFYYICIFLVIDVRHKS